jgi:carbamoyl-phosphate synthase large subunit
MEFRVLVTSLAKKVPLVKAIRKAFQVHKLSGKIVGADSDDSIIGKYFVDEFWHMPSLNDISVSDILTKCRKLKINAIIPTRDGELEFFADHQKELLQNNIACMVSDAATISVCFDKLSFYKALSSSKIPIIHTSSDMDFNAPSYVVKERYGSGSFNIGLNLTKNAALEYAKKLNNPIFQPYIIGKEYTVDLYVAKLGHALGSIARSRDLVVNGEAQITQSVFRPDIENYSMELAEKLNLYGHVLFQVMEETKTNRLHFIECNPRFGGASTLSLAMGLRSLEWFFAEALNQDPTLLPFKRSPEELKQVRYPEDYVFHDTRF